MAGDHVDEVLHQWRREHPELDVSPMGVIGRISRVSATLDRRIATVMAEHDLQPGEFDLLATLRRSGPPYQLTVGGLLESVMVTSGAVTNRLNRLVEKGLVSRDVDPENRRSVIVALTDTGLRRVEAALIDHVENERTCLQALDADQQAALTDLLRMLLLDLET